MSMPLALEHINRYGEANLDTTTLRIIRGHAIKANAEDARIRALMSEEVAKAEWDPVFAQDTINRNEAIDRISAELAKRERAEASPR